MLGLGRQREPVAHIGMRERVTLYGGQLDVGPVPDGGFEVRACLPLEPPL